MAIVGGAVLTPVMGLLSARSLASAYLVPLGCYVFIMLYAFSGARILRNQNLD